MSNNQQSKFPNNILITGTPGVGKTSMSILLADELKNQFNLDYQVINIGDLIHNKKLYDSWNQEFNVPEFNEDKVIEELEKMKIEEGGFIIDFHSGCIFPEEWFSLIVLLRCNNTELFDRLKGRGYNDKKIMENIECEIMEITADEIKESYDINRIIELRNEKTEEMQDNIEKIIAKFKTLV